MLLPAHIIAPAYSLFDNGALHAVLTLQLAVPLVALGLALGRLPWRMALACGGLIIAGLATAVTGPQPLAPTPSDIEAPHGGTLSTVG